MPGSAPKYQTPVKGKNSNLKPVQAVQASGSSKKDDSKSQKVTKSTTGVPKTIPNAGKVSGENYGPMDSGINWGPSDAFSSFLLDNSNVHNRLHAQTEGQRQLSPQERRDQMRISVHGWELPDYESYYEIRSPGLQSASDMDALLSQVGTWPGVSDMYTSPVARKVEEPKLNGPDTNRAQRPRNLPL